MVSYALRDRRIPTVEREKLPAIRVRGLSRRDCHELRMLNAAEEKEEEEKTNDDPELPFEEMNGETRL